MQACVVNSENEPEYHEATSELIARAVANRHNVLLVESENSLRQAKVSFETTRRLDSLALIHFSPLAIASDKFARGVYDLVNPHVDHVAVLWIEN